MNKFILTGIAVPVMAAWNASATIVYQTPAGSSDSDGPVSAQAIITFGNGSMTMILQNLVTGSHLSQGQALSGVIINFGSDTAVTSSTTFGTGFSATTGDFYAIGVDPLSITTLTGPLSNADNHWGYASGNGKLTVATAGAGADGGSPVDMILPDGTTYVGGISSHNPYVIGAALFTFYNPLFTTNSTITSLSFEFGTGPDKTIVGRLPSVPEPSTVIAGALLLLPFGFSALRIFRKGRLAKAL